MQDINSTVHESCIDTMLNDTIAKIDLMDADIYQRLSLTEDDYD
jgi:hypothetical protein